MSFLISVMSNQWGWWFFFWFSGNNCFSSSHRSHDYFVFSFFFRVCLSSRGISPLGSFLHRLLRAQEKKNFFLGKFRSYKRCTIFQQWCFYNNYVKLMCLLCIAVSIKKKKKNNKTTFWEKFLLISTFQQLTLTKTLVVACCLNTQCYSV